MNTLEKKLLPIAKKWAGNIPIWEVKKAGIDPSAVRHWAKDNPNVLHFERGVYTWIDPELDFDLANAETARQVAQGGEDAYLWGPSVLELMEIGDVGEPYTYVAVPKRRRSRPRTWWVIEQGKKTTTYGGIPVQGLEDAITASMPMLDDRKQCSVLDAVENRFPEEKEFIQKVAKEYGYDE